MLGGVDPASELTGLCQPWALDQPVHLHYPPGEFFLEFPLFDLTFSLPLFFFFLVFVSESTLSTPTPISAPAPYSLSF